MTTAQKETPQELHNRLRRLPDPVLLPSVPPLPSRKEHLQEMYERFLTLMIKRSIRYTDRTHLWNYVGEYWAKRCIEEGLRRGDLVRDGKRSYKFVYRTFVPQNPDEIRARLLEIEMAIAGGEDCGVVCERYGISAQMLGAWRRNYGRKRTENSLQEEPAQAEVEGLRIKLKAQAMEIERLHGILTQVKGAVDAFVVIP